MADYNMTGYPLNDTNLSLCPSSYQNFDYLSTCSPESVMENMGNVKGITWLPIITMREELINHMKDDFQNDITLDEEEEKYLEGTSNLIIKFIDRFKSQLEKMNKAEEVMKKAIIENNKDIDVLSTFITFLEKVNKKCSQDTSQIEKDIKDICDDIQKNNNIKEARDTYILEKKKYHKYLNIIKLFNQMNVGSTCSICLCENVTSYFNPCGHTACESCIDRNKDNTCPLCRANIRNTHKLYFI